MSLANAQKMIFGGDETRLLIDESPYQFLPSLAQILSDTGALMCQQLHYVARHPYFEGERLATQWLDGLFFVQIPVFMWVDSIEGFLRHLSKRTFERKSSELIKVGVWVVRDRVGHYRDRENHKWYAMDYAKFKHLEDEHHKCFMACKAQRESERSAVKTASDGTAGWRPPSGVDTSRNIGEWCPVLEEATPDDELKPKPRKKRVRSSVSQAVRQNGGRSKPPKMNDDLADNTNDKLADETNDDLADDVGDNVADATSANMAGLSLYKRQEDTSKIQINTASLELSSANADAEVESSLILSGEGTSESEQRLEPTPPAQPAQQIALPETALAALPSPLPEPLATMATRLYEVAMNEYGIKCDQELAARIVSRSPLATMSDAAILRMIGPDHAEAGLDKPLFGQKKRDLASDIPSLRWLLFTWPAHRAEVEAWAARKNRRVNLAGAFVTKWEEGTLPPREWIAGKFGAVHAEIRAEKTAQEEERAKEVWDGLGKQERAIVRREEVLRAAERGANNYNDLRGRESAERRRLLLDAEFVIALPSMVEAETKTEVAPAPAVTEALEATAPMKYVPSASELVRIEFHARKLLPIVRRGELDLDGAEDHAIGQYLYSPKQAAVIREMVEALLDAEKQKKEAA